MIRGTVRLRVNRPATAHCLALLVCGCVTVTAWSDLGAQDETGALDLAGRRSEHWVWHENPAVTPPAVQDSRWPQNAIDPFILSKLEAAGLVPAARADRRTLIRRAHLDGIGLPPTPEQIDAFLSDPSENAFETVVDALLRSPHFGERWGRHWLDLVRYAESYGHEFDFPIEHAWRYRDYVIRALNADLPYDQFVREHIAGDLLAEQRMHPTEKYPESILATGWWFLYEQTHAPTDVRQHESDRIDNQIDVLTKTFLGLTVGCARCHDHKFDAISTEDFYALSGYLQSSRQQEAYLDPGKKIALGVEKLEALRAKADATLAATVGAARPEPEAPTSEVKSNTVLFEDFAEGTLAERGWFPTGWAWGDAVTGSGDSTEWDRMSGRASWAKPGVAHSGRLGPQLMGTLSSSEFDLTHRQVAMRVCGKGRAWLVIDSYRLSPMNSLIFRGTHIEIDTKGKWQWVRIDGETYLYSGTGEHRAHLEFIDDDPDAYLAIDEIRFTEGGLEEEGATEAFLPSVDPETDAAFAAVASQMDVVANDIPAPMRALTIMDGTPEDNAVYVRGVWKTEGEVVPRRFLTAVAGDDQPRPPATSSGRLELAERMLDVGAPLVSRTIVNRIWHHLMGRGIAATVDNFGELGEPPTHPELLDWLSAEFRRDGWSIKRMLKRVMMSSTYQMSSKAATAEAEKRDPTNALLHRMRVKRLEGEVIRDAVLAISGRLDTQMYGPPVLIHLTEFMEGRSQPKWESGPLDSEGRRSIYVHVRRNFLWPMMLAFDTPQPFNTVGRRTVSNVPAQALIMLNDPLIVQQAAVWADRVIAAEPDPAQRIQRMHVEAFGRGAEPDQLRRMLAFIDEQGEARGVASDQRARHELLWADLAHVLFNVKEFIFVP